MENIGTRLEVIGITLPADSAEDVSHQMSDTIIELFDGKPIEFSTGDAFVNLTAMCAAFGKRPGDFLSLPSYQRYQIALATVTGQLPDYLVVKKEGSGGGTWAHPEIAMECARWLSPEFSIWCNRTIRRILAGEQVTMAPVLPAITFPEALRMLADAEEKKAALLIENAELKPKAEFFDTVADSTGTMSLNECAKLVGIGRNKMMHSLRSARVLIGGGNERNTPYQRYIDDGYFRVIETKWESPDGTVNTTRTTRVYQRGVDFIRRKLSPTNNPQN